METIEEIKKEVRRVFEAMDGWKLGSDTSDERFIDEVARLYANSRLEEAANIAEPYSEIVAEEIRELKEEY